jgi:hypothetical protein
MIPADVWHYVLRPTIAQTLGWAVFVSTPKGRNWFYDLYTRGLDPAEPDYAALSFPSSASPYFPASELEDARRTLPEDVFRQEYEACFLEDSAGVFRGVDACLIGGDLATEGTENTRLVTLHRRQIVIGADLAKNTENWDVLTAELQRYEYQISSTGNISYNAPSGYHDDCVIALALANWGRWQAGNVGMMARLLGAGGKRQGARGKRLGERVVVG